MRMDEVMTDEPPPEAGSDETHAAKWARPQLEAFEAKEKAITFQVRFLQLFLLALCRYFEPSWFHAPLLLACERQLLFSYPKEGSTQGERLCVRSYSHFFVACIMA